MVGDLVERENAKDFRERFLVLKYVGPGYSEGQLYHTIRFTSTDDFKTSTTDKYLLEYYPEFLDTFHIVSQAVNDTI